MIELKLTDPDYIVIHPHFQASEDMRFVDYVWLSEYPAIVKMIEVDSLGNSVGVPFAK